MRHGDGMDLIGVGELLTRVVADPDDDTPLVAIDLDAVNAAQVAAAAAALECSGARVVIGLARKRVPNELVPLLERLTCTLAVDGPAPYCAGGCEDLPMVADVVNAAPRASVTLAGILRAGAARSVSDGLLLESLAYSMLLAGPEFAAWRACTARGLTVPTAEPVRLRRDGDTLVITLNRPDRHNAYDAAMRDALVDALEVARVDDSLHVIRLDAAGPSFCSGGDLDEFGTTPDVVTAHLIRMARSAGRLVHELRDRVAVRVHGACIGAGVEIPSFATRVDASPDAYFQLPELHMGLIPGAGGTVSMPRRIGRWRTAYLALTARRIDADTALRWGLVDGIAG